MDSGMRIVTICGPYRYWHVMARVYRHLTNRGEIVLMPAGPKMTYNTADFYQWLHREKIMMSSYILVVDTDGVDAHIGEDTQREIDFAESEGIDVVYLSEYLVERRHLGLDVDDLL